MIASHPVHRASRRLLRWIEAVSMRSAFADLAARDRFRALVAKHVERGAEPQPQPWMFVQL